MAEPIMPELIRLADARTALTYERRNLSAQSIALTAAAVKESMAALTLSFDRLALSYLSLR